MVTKTTRQTAGGDVAAAVQAVLPFLRFIIVSLLELPNGLCHYGIVFRGVKYHGPQSYNLEAVLRQGL